MIDRLAHMKIDTQHYVVYVSTTDSIGDIEELIQRYDSNYKRYTVQYLNSRQFNYDYIPVQIYNPFDLPWNVTCKCL